jgi:hypothetical protein
MWKYRESGHFSSLYSKSGSPTCSISCIVQRRSKAFESTILNIYIISLASERRCKVRDKSAHLLYVYAVACAAEDKACFHGFGEAFGLIEYSR